MKISALTVGQLSKPCAVCSKPFQYVRLTARYCSEACKKAASREGQKPPTKPKKPRKSQLYHLVRSNCGKLFIKAARKAGTVQIFPQDTTIQDFHDLWGLHVQRGKANGTGAYRLESSEQYELCHLSPAIGKDGSRGILHPRNLVVGLGTVNKHLGNKPTIYSSLDNLSVKSSALKSTWKITNDDTDTDIINKINKWLNGSLMKYQKEAKHRAYVKPASNGFEGMPPIEADRVLISSLTHIQRHHSSLFRPVLRYCHKTYAPAIVPDGLGDFRYQVTTWASYKYLLTGKFDGLSESANDDSYDWGSWAA